MMHINLFVYRTCNMLCERCVCVCDHPPTVLYRALDKLAASTHSSASSSALSSNIRCVLRMVYLCGLSESWCIIAYALHHAL